MSKDSHEKKERVWLETLRTFYLGWANAAGILSRGFGAQSQTDGGRSATYAYVEMLLESLARDVDAALEKGLADGGYQSAKEIAALHLSFRVAYWEGLQKDYDVFGAKFTDRRAGVEAQWAAGRHSLAQSERCSRVAVSLPNCPPVPEKLRKNLPEDLRSIH